MWDELLKGLLIAAGAAAAAEVGSKLLTGKWAHEHLYEWWRELSERIDAWVKQHQEYKIAHVVAWLNCKLDNAVVSANRLVKVAFRGESVDPTVQPIVIEEVELSAEEVAAQFPELRQQYSAVVATYQPMAMQMSHAEQQDEAQSSDQEQSELKKVEATSAEKYCESTVSATDPNRIRTDRPSSTERDHQLSVVVTLKKERDVVFRVVCDDQVRLVRYSYGSVSPLDAVIVDGILVQRGDGMHYRKLVLPFKISFLGGKDYSACIESELEGLFSTQIAKCSLVINGRRFPA